MLISKNTNINIQVVNGTFKPTLVVGLKPDVIFAFVMVFRGMLQEKIFNKNDLNFIVDLATASEEEIVDRVMKHLTSLDNLFEALAEIEKDPEKAPKGKAPEDVAKDFDELLKGFFQNLREEKDK